MRRFNRWLAAMPRHAWDLFAFLGRPDGITVDRLPSATGFRRVGLSFDRERPPTTPPGDWAAFLAGVQMQPHGCVETWVMAGLCANGVKVFAPTADEFRALSQVEIGVTWGEYRQPFPVLVVVVPDGVFAGPVGNGTGVPVAMTLRHDPANRLFASMLTHDAGPGTIVGNYTWDGDGDTIDEHIGRVAELDPTGGLASPESEMLLVVRRAALNAAMLLVNGGMRAIGPANPEYAAKLESSLTKKHLPEPVRTANAHALRTMPTLYAFDQSVRVFRRETVHADATDPTGVVVSPHWRRGHWARVACGAGRAERRLVFREAVMVNAHLFGGRAADTRVLLTV
jgi:hypothetical protein